MAQSLLEPVMRSAFHHDLFSKLPMLNDDTMRVFVKKGVGKTKEYMMYAKALSIAWGNDSNYWRWVKLEKDEKVKVAELIKVNWLEVRGKIQTNLLEPRVKYEVFFVIKMKYNSNTEPDVMLTLETPNARKQERKLPLNALPTKEWILAKIGEFETGDVDMNQSEEVKFSLINVDSPLKRWLMIEGVRFQPVY